MAPVTAVEDSFAGNVLQPLILEFCLGGDGVLVRLPNLGSSLIGSYGQWIQGEA